MSQPPQPSASTAHSHLDALQPACEHLRAGGLVILPTDTVYGIGCNAADAGAVERLLASKGRGRQMPPPVLVAGPADLTGVVAQVPEAARALKAARTVSRWLVLVEDGRMSGAVPTGAR